MILQFMYQWNILYAMGLSPDTDNYGFRMRWECRERFPRRSLQKKLPASDPDMHHVMHVGVANPRWRGKRSWHSRCIRNPQFTYFETGPWQMDILAENNSIKPMSEATMPSLEAMLTHLQWSHLAGAYVGGQFCSKRSRYQSHILNSNISNQTPMPDQLCSYAQFKIYWYRLRQWPGTEL